MSRRRYSKYLLSTRYESGLYFVQATLIHGRSAHFWLLFDSGAAYCGIAKDIAESIGLRAEGEEQIGSIQGETVRQFATVDRIVLGLRANQGEPSVPVQVSDVKVVFLDPNWSKWLRQKVVVGLLGANFIKEFGFYIGAGALKVYVQTG